MANFYNQSRQYKFENSWKSPYFPEFSLVLSKIETFSLELTYPTRVSQKWPFELLTWNLCNFLIVFNWIFCFLYIWLFLYSGTRICVKPLYISSGFGMIFLSHNTWITLLLFYIPVHLIILKSDDPYYRDKVLLDHLLSDNIFLIIYYWQKSANMF